VNVEYLSVAAAKLSLERIHKAESYVESLSQMLKVAREKELKKHFYLKYLMNILLISPITTAATQTVVLFVRRDFNKQLAEHLKKQAKDK